MNVAMVMALITLRLFACCPTMDNGLVYDFDAPSMLFDERYPAPCWYSDAFLLASMRMSRTYLQLRHDKAMILCKDGSINTIGISCTSEMLASRHATFFRLLLLVSGDVESNPGPMPQLNTLTNAVLSAMLQTLHEGEDDYNVPRTKAELITELNGEDQKAVRLAYNVAIAVPVQPAAQQPPQPAPQVSSQPVKLPEFNDKDVHVWFEIIEQLLDGRSEKVKKNSLLSYLPSDILLNTGAKVSDNFGDIKSQIIRFYDESDQKRLHKLLQEQHLGDRKPSVLLRQMQKLAPGNDGVIKIRFLELMPDNIRVILASLDSTLTIEQMADTADKMVEQMPHASTNSTVPPQSDIDRRLSAMMDQIEALTTQVQAIKADSRSRSRSPGPSHRRYDRSRSKSKGRWNKSGLCFYHSKFGTKAYNCQSPCSWKQNGVSGNANAPPQTRP